MIARKVYTGTIKLDPEGRALAKRIEKAIDALRPAGQPANRSAFIVRALDAYSRDVLQPAPIWSEQPK